jgi:hypothetical protein
MWLWLDDTRNPGLVLLRYRPCTAKGCPVHGPAVLARLRRHYVDRMDGYPIRRRVIAAAAQDSALRKLRRDGHQWLPIPAPGGELVLYATGGPGEPVADLDAALAADLQASPPDRRIRPSRDWAVRPEVVRSAGRYRLRGVLRPTTADRITQTVTAHEALADTIPDATDPPLFVVQEPTEAKARGRLVRDLGLRVLQAAERPDGGL